MRRIFFFVLIIVCANLCKAQELKSAFAAFESWSKIKQKASSDHKYIYLECYAANSDACMQMEIKTFSEPQVIERLKARFVAVKIQLDTNTNDDNFVKGKHYNVNFISKNYKITTFPSSIIFSFDGKILHYEEGFIPAEAFLSFLDKVDNPKEQFYTQLDVFNSGRMSTSDLRPFAEMALVLHQNEIANKAANLYIKKQLDNQSNNVIYSKDQLNFLSTFSLLLDAKGKTFHSLIHSTAKRIDAVVNTPGFAKSLITSAIYNSEIKPFLNRAIVHKKFPSWGVLKKKLVTLFGDYYGVWSFQNAQLEYFAKKKDWLSYSNTFIDKQNLFGVDTTNLMAYVNTNNILYNITFLHVQDKVCLLKAAQIMHLINQAHPNIENHLDTEAGLLYKAGRIEEALTIESHAVDIRPDNKDLQENYKKMKAGQKTW